MKMIILIGLPGSGKSTLSLSKYKEYVRINQDQLGSRDKCIEVLKDALDAGKDVIIDRCNTTKQQRQYWISLALEYNVESIIGLYLEVDPEECIARIMERKGHETITQNLTLEKKREIVYNFYRSIQKPELNEGFSSIIFTRG